MGQEYQKEPYWLVLQAQVKQCLLRHVLDKLKFLSFLSVDLSLFNFMQVWELIEYVICLKMRKNKLQQLYLLTKLMLLEEKEKTNLEVLMMKEPIH